MVHNKTQSLGYPFDYGDVLTPEQARKNLNAILVRVMLVLWILRGNQVHARPDKVEAFTSQPQTTNNRVVKNQGLFGSSSQPSDSQPSGSQSSDSAGGGPGKPNGGGGIIPSFPQFESVEESEKLFDQLQEVLYGTKKSSKGKECKLDEQKPKAAVEQKSKKAKKTSKWDRPAAVDNNYVITDEQAQAKYKHARDLNVTGQLNRTNVELYKDQIQLHLNDTNTVSKLGTFKKTIPVCHFFNTKTGVNVMFRLDTREFFSAWLLTDEQMANVVTRGTL